MSFLMDVRYAARGLKRRPALTAVTTFALTVGIAANAIMFGVVDQLLVQPPAHVVAPERVHRLYFEWRDDGKVQYGPVTTYPVVDAFKTAVPAFSDVAGFSSGTYTLGRGPEAQSVAVELVSGNYFKLLGVRPAMGRTFVAGEDTVPRGAQVIVVSDGFWRSRMGTAPDVLGRSLEVDGKLFTVIGVAPAGFNGIDRTKVDGWVPLSAMAPDNHGADWYRVANSWWVQSIGRLTPSATPELAAMQSTAAARARFRALGEGDTTTNIVFGPLIGTRSPNGVTAEGKVSLWLMGVSIIVLLIACANVANLLIARTLERRREIAVRLAMGVSRGRLARQLLTEAALLAGIAAGAALIATYWGSKVVRETLLPGMVWSESVFDARVLGFTLAVTVACILLAGLLPALHGVRTSVSESLKASSRGFAGSRGRLRFGLLVMQAGLSVVLLVGAGLFVKSLRRVDGRDIGVDRDRVALVTMNLSRFGFPEPRVAEVYQAARERVSAQPGVESAVLVSASVPARSGTGMSIAVPGVVKNPRLPGGGPYWAGVSAQFFPTMGARMLSGRAFVRAEEEAPARVAIVNEALAKGYWPTGNPVGQCVKLGSDKACTTIVGIVQNIVLFSMIRDDRAMLYLPPKHAAFTRPPSALILRTTGAPEALIPQLRKEIQSVAPGMPFVQIRSFEDIFAPQLRPWRLGATMFVLFGGIALVIAAIGLYSVMAYWVSQRTQEIGVRMALGAQRADVVGLVAKQASAAIVAGLLLGSAVALLASRFIADMLYETSARDPLVYIGAAAVILLAGAVASIIPARRSAAVDPVIALRSD